MLSFEITIEVYEQIVCILIDFYTYRETNHYPDQIKKDMVCTLPLIIISTIIVIINFINFVVRLLKLSK